MQSGRGRTAWLHRLMSYGLIRMHQLMVRECGRLQKDGNCNNVAFGFDCFLLGLTECVAEPTVSFFYLHFKWWNGYWNIYWRVEGKFIHSSMCTALKNLSDFGQGDFLIFLGKLNGNILNCLTIKCFCFDVFFKKKLFFINGLKLRLLISQYFKSDAFSTAEIDLLKKNICLFQSLK